jgi:hypothetical protein
MNAPVDVTNVDESGFQRLESVDTLQPGYYWRVTKSIDVESDDGWKHKLNLPEGEVLLLLSIADFDGAAHSVSLLCHPRHGDRSTYRLLVSDFLSHFEPAPDGEAVRQREVADVMQDVQDLQQQMLQAESNPLALPGVQEEVKEAIEKFERESVAEAQREEKTQQERSKDINRILRRAARRSTAAGNPLTVRRVAVSDNVDLMLSEGVTSEGLKELTLEAKRRTAIAEATARWLTTQGKTVAQKLEALAPYYGERGRVALARADKTIRYVKRITEGLTSLKLYTGDGVDVMTIAHGQSARSDEPLTLVQQKKFADEELAVWADVADNFDWRSLPQFFEALKKDKLLLEQIFPASRCVVAMATSRREIVYGDKMSALERAMNDIANKRVFLLVRDGENIHAVYSSEPSHELLPRLFPSRSQVDAIFTGMDGTRIGLQDIAFAKANENHELLRICYLRLLILLCGLDHRLKLFGEFYPPEEGLSFMQESFQSRYFSFLADDEHEHQVEDGLPDVRTWLEQCNMAVRAGSRVAVLHHGLTSPLLQRQSALQIDYERLDRVLVVARQGDKHVVHVPLTWRYEFRRGHRLPAENATVVLDGSKADRRWDDWFLCLDKVRLGDLRRYIYSRRSRAGDISWLRTFKYAAALIERDLAEEKELRDYLRETALDNGVLSPDQVEDAVQDAIATWRASHRGAPAPTVAETKEVNALLSLIFPADKIATATSTQMEAVAEQLGSRPLRLVRTGRNKLVLYVEPTDEDRAQVPGGVQFGWVRRVPIEAQRTKFKAGEGRLVWLARKKPDASEQVVQDWPAIETWLHPHDEPCRLDDLKQFKALLAGSLEWEPMLKAGRGARLAGSLPEALHQALLEQAARSYRKLTYFETLFVGVPLGVGQKAVGEPAKFLYGAMSYPHFVYRYGTDKQFEEVMQQCINRFPGVRAEVRQSVRANGTWHLRLADRPLKDAFVSNALESGSAPSWWKLSTREKGGGGYTSKVLSFNRALAITQGQDPYGRRAFYKDRRSRVRWSVDFTDYSKEARAKRHAEHNRPWKPTMPVWELSPMVWNHERGRPVANDVLSVTDPRPPEAGEEERALRRDRQRDR